eukprot:TRINITY_DN5773_c0_g1_i2.p1 TRINITY_DN5773_c0_g1~~TRINITY_DN5773_c0_g1_i2.p1  ORF type:complete len:201 (-),score=27.66 TRINITY_DN5773_c0_g1_i2:246-848(-)
MMTTKRKRFITNAVCRALLLFVYLHRCQHHQQQMHHQQSEVAKAWKELDTHEEKSLTSPPPPNQTAAKLGIEAPPTAPTPPARQQTNGVRVGGVPPKPTTTATTTRDGLVTQALQPTAATPVSSLKLSAPRTPAQSAVQLAKKHTASPIPVLPVPRASVPVQPVASLRVRPQKLPAEVVADSSPRLGTEKGEKRTRSQTY